MKAIILFQDNTSTHIDGLRTCHPDKAVDRMDEIATQMATKHGKGVRKVVLRRKDIAAERDEVVCGEKRYGDSHDYAPMRKAVGESREFIIDLFYIYEQGLINYHDLAERIINVGKGIEEAGIYC